MTDTLARIAQLDACAVSDALDRLSLPGAVTGIQRLTTTRRISGRVITVKMGRDEGQPPASRHLGTTAIESAQPGDVIVMEQRTGIDAACWGGNLSLGARLRQIAGVIVDGPARDIDEAREYDFTVFARSTTSRTARGRIVEAGTNVPITVGEVTVAPGDFVVADGSAVVFIARSEVVRVLEAAEAVAARERAMVAALRDGTPISKVMGGDYETMLKKTGGSA
ncbi:MAG TPA: RraA family protein [Vicinamibacterales bacterium]|jgi:regulator of RNase E activity RraA|nr:RraA family protein [Vicinamibacterales bacterium]